MGFAETISILSLNTTLALFNASVVAGTLPITAATVTTPIAVTSPSHGVPLGRNVHAVITGVVGAVEANGLWELTPTDANTFTLASYSAQGIPFPSVGVHTYVSGGTISYAFPDYRILLGRRWVDQLTSVASPRIIFVPTRNPKPWDFKPYGGLGPAPRGERGSAEQQSEKQQPLVTTKYCTFEVHITGAATPPSPDQGDFDAVEAIEDTLLTVMFDAITPPGFQVIGDDWVSQKVTSGTQTQRGQKHVLIVQIARPVARQPLAQFVPNGTSIVFSVEPTNAASGDITVIEVS
jgi:hypothetical protein